MQRLITLLILTLFITENSLKAQLYSEGIYISAKDFEHQKISFPKTTEKKYKLHLNVFGHTVKLVSDNERKVFQTDSLFGFIKDGINFRFYKKQVYQIVSIEEDLIIYSKNCLGGYKHTEVITDYFFSLGAALPLYSLTIYKNLNY